MAVTPRVSPSPLLALGQGGGLRSSGKCCNRILPLCRKTSLGNIPMRQQAEMAPPGKVKTQRSSDFWGRKHHSRQRPMGLVPAPRTSHQPQIFPSEAGHWQPWVWFFSFFFFSHHPQPFLSRFPAVQGGINLIPFCVGTKLPPPR